jgi:16S rRNA (uracil1498-N3)-methyltransferase
LPRLFVDNELKKNGSFTLNADQAHYLKNVMRRKSGDKARFFNGRDGEWLGVLSVESREIAAEPVEQLKTQPPARPETRLLFAPIKKDPLAWLIGKSVELGVSRLQPVLTQNTEMRKINLDKIRLHLIEASEQCERLDVPVIEEPLSFKDAVTQAASLMPIYACIERADAPMLAAALKPGPAALLIGPEGGFDAAEKEFLRAGGNIVPVSLGELVLRAETAACVALAACAIGRDLLKR